MRALFLSLSLLVALPAAAEAGANQAFLKAESFTAVATAAGAPRSATDRRWRAVKPFAVVVTPQRSVRLNDKRANAALAKAGPKTLQVRAAYDGRSLALLITWPDATEDHANDETMVFGDAVAIEFPKRFGAGQRLPYIGMGDDEQNVVLYLQRAVPYGSVNQEYVAAGFGSLTRTHQLGLKGTLTYNAKRKEWTAFFSRPLKLHGHSLKAPLVPIAFAVWDGHQNERGGNKHLSSWHFIRVGKDAPSEAYLSELSWGYGEGDLGDPAKGQQIVSTVCVACHKIGDTGFAPEGLAPNLGNIGAIARYTYLRDSVQTPSAVIVPNLHINRHYNPSGAQDAYRARPNNDAYQWFTKGPNGKKTSKMPPFMMPDDLGAIVAYLKTLHGPVPAKAALSGNAAQADLTQANGAK